MRMEGMKSPPGMATPEARAVTRSVVALKAASAPRP